MFESLLTSRLEMRKIVENHTWREEKFRMALTIDERCEVSKDFGTTFYEKVEDCEDILKTLQEVPLIFALTSLKPRPSPTSG